MRVTVFGASGKVGRLVVTELLARGYEVIAFVHAHDPFDGRVKTVKGDAHVATDVAKAVRGSDMVISTLGSWGTKDKDIVSAGIRNIITMMEAKGIKRLVSLTGSEARDPADQPGLFQKVSHLGASLLVRKIVEDGEEHLRLLRASSLDWTTIRSPVMNNFGGTGYKLQDGWLSHLRTINRRAVARAMVDQLEDEKYFRQSPIIQRRRGV